MYAKKEKININCCIHVFYGGFTEVKLQGREERKIGPLHPHFYGNQATKKGKKGR